jgi:hypothetical protein
VQNDGVFNVKTISDGISKEQESKLKTASVLSLSWDRPCWMRIQSRLWRHATSRFRSVFQLYFFHDRINLVLLPIAAIFKVVLVVDGKDLSENPAGRSRINTPGDN